MIWLLDASVLIGLTHSDHTAHDRCAAWFADDGVTAFATCPITQGALVRFTLGRRPDLGIGTALSILESVTSDARHVFWADDAPLGEIRWDGVVGHRQVTDAYLAGLARRHEGRLVTIDSGLATLHADVSTIVG